MSAYNKRHPVVARSDNRARRAAFIREIETAGDESLGASIDRLESADALTDFGKWQLTAMTTELESRS